MLGFEIGQRESGFYSERTESQAESHSHPVAYLNIDVNVHVFCYEGGSLCICQEGPQAGLYDTQSNRCDMACNRNIVESYSSIIGLYCQTINDIHSNIEAIC